MASIIDPTLAQNLINEYQQQNAAPGGPALLTPENLYLNGYYIDRESLDTILSNPNFVGLSVYLAKNPDFSGSNKNVFTIVFSGAANNPEYDGTTATNPYINPGNAYEYTDICPPRCGGGGFS